MSILFFPFFFQFVPALCSILFRGRLVSVLAEVSQLLLVTFVVVTLALVRSALYFFLISLDFIYLFHFFGVVTLALVRGALHNDCLLVCVCVCVCLCVCVCVEVQLSSERQADTCTLLCVYAYT